MSLTEIAQACGITKRGASDALNTIGVDAKERAADHVAEGACQGSGSLWPHAQCPKCGLLYGPGHLAQKQADGGCDYCQRDAERAKGRVRRE